MADVFRLAVLSGKGGTGKTFVSTNLANVIPESIYMDCDVEEPNGSFFFNLENLKNSNVSVKIPTIDTNRCNGCRICTSFCEFNALAFIHKQVKVFEEVCHSCGGCSLVCPQKAITEKDKVIGIISEDKIHHPTIRSGKLNIGEESGVSIIRQMLHMPHTSSIEIIDSPPGTSCSVVESISDADFCLIVGEPTLYSLENLKMVVELVRGMKIPFGIIINKEIEKENILRFYANTENIPILTTIPFRRDYALLSSDGKLLTKIDESLKEKFILLYEYIREVLQ